LKQGIAALIILNFLKNSKKLFALLAYKFGNLCHISKQDI